MRVPDCHYGQDIVMAFLPPVVGCLVKKGLQKGGPRAPQDPPGYALACFSTNENNVSENNMKQASSKNNNS